ncbi:MAG TPA: ester cyclase [Pyrinomonadaceae bacterium]|nr:ester cyclase [Pyrinomonadaceae bacterium]
MSVEQENKKIVRRFFEEFWNERKLEIAEEIFAPGAVTHQLQSGAETAGVPRGGKAVREHAGEWLRAFPDLRFTVERMIAEGDLVVTYATMRGTHAENWLGIPAGGKRVGITMAVTHRIDGGKITADWVLVESLGFFQQLGLLPPTEEFMSDGAQQLK